MPTLSTTKPKRKRRPRCVVCRKRVTSATSFTCRCDKKPLCGNCRYPSQHECDFDYTTLVTTCEKVAPEKICTS